MPKHFFLTFLAVCLLIIPACAEAPLSSGHKVNPNTDVIIGSMEAPNELIIYLSPGHKESLTFFLKHYRQMKSQYIDKNKLRLIIREVPELIFHLKDEDGKSNKYEEAKKHSTMLATHLRCAKHYHGDEAYAKTWDLIGISVAIPAARMNAANWPYYNQKATEAVFFNMGKGAQITKEEYISCEKDPLQTEFQTLFDRYADILTKSAGVSMPPAAFMNGKQIEMTEGNKHAEIMLFLKENLEEEYKH